MGDDTLMYPAGSVLVVTDGDYSSFEVCGAVVTIKECDLRGLKAQYVDAWRKKGLEVDKSRTWAVVYYGDSRNAEGSGFLAWLVVNGHALPLHYSQMYFRDI